MNFKTTIQKELDTFFQKISDDDFSIREVTKGAFSQARLKVDPLLFKRLNKVVADTFYRRKEYHKWHGFRLLAVDGSRVQLPKHKTITEEFGIHGMGPNADSEQSLGLISMLYDVLNLITLDASIDKYTSSESEHLQNHLARTQVGDLILLDRGYPSFYLLFLLKAKGLEFCVRLKEDWWKIVNEFNKEPEMEKIVSLHLPKKDREKLEGYPEYQNTTIKVRLVKVILNTGEVEILCTSLLDSEQYKIAEFKDLYNKRWNIEEDGYKMLKCRAELENWSGKSATVVKQDFYSKILLLSLLSAYKHPIEAKVKEEFRQTDQRKHQQAVNKTFSLTIFREGLIALFNKEKVKEVIGKMDKLMYQTREIVRPNRTFQRKKKPKNKYYPNYKHY